MLLPQLGRAMPAKTPSTILNRILSRLSAPDRALLEPHLTAVDLPLRKKLELSRRPIEHVYFPESGIVSVVANGGGKHLIEVGLIGREGMTGLAIVMGVDRSAHDSIVQSAGRALRISSAKVRDAIRTSPSLHQKMLSYADAFMMQAGFTALAMGEA